jgi:SAM-dependent methyltransferase
VDKPLLFGRPIGSSTYLAIALVAGSVIALQICIMRIYAVGNWVHFGSLVVSLALLGFGLTSAVMCAGKAWFERHWRAITGAALLLFGPLAVAANLTAQQLPFNAIFLISDPRQKWLLLANFLLYFLPFLAGALFIGTVLLQARTAFNRVYFADLVGSGLCGLSMLGAMYLFPPENLIVAPLILWLAGGALWFAGSRRALLLLGCAGMLSIGGHYLVPGWLGITKLATSDYKGVAYARKFPDARRVYHDISPFGELELYSSSYLHFAPGLSDNAAFNLPEVPANAYWGMYVDGEGPTGVLRNLPTAQTTYFRYLPMEYPYVLKQAPDTFVVQFAGGISTSVALRSGSKSVTVAEANPAILDAFLNHREIRDFTGDMLHDLRVKTIAYDGRLYLARSGKLYDVVDLSLADSAGLSNPGGFAIVEKYGYTEEAMQTYMRALRPGGILSVTLWNKEDPPKSVLRLYATMADAARGIDAGNLANSFYAVSTYLSTTTVLYKRGGFTPDEIAKLHETSKDLSFDEVYYPGMDFDPRQTDGIISAYHDQIFGAAAAGKPADNAPAAASADASDPTLDPTADDADTDDNTAPQVLPSIQMDRVAWHALIAGDWDAIAARYVFDTHPLTNDRPYFAAYEKVRDLPHITDRLELFQDDWGYLLLWATLGVACATSLVLILFPVALGWRSIFSHNPGKFGTIIYFACLGLGYIMVEVGLIAKFVEALGNATVSAAVLITGMLVFSGLGSLCSERILGRARRAMPLIFLAIGALLIGYGRSIDPVLEAVGSYGYAARLLFCFLLIAPPTFLMGFPMPTAMTALGRLGKDHMYIWAWGINGCFSVIGAALVPIIATTFGLAAVLEISGLAYLLAIPSFFAVLLPKFPGWNPPG